MLEFWVCFTGTVAFEEVGFTAEVFFVLFVLLEVVFFVVFGSGLSGTEMVTPFGVEEVDFFVWVLEVFVLFLEETTVFPLVPTYLTVPSGIVV